MRLLLDEMLSPAIARELRERGHDALAVADHPGWVALSDPEVMNLARTERGAVVTGNLRDYRPLHADAITPGGPGHFGMIFMPGTYRRTKEDTGRIIAALEARLKAAECLTRGDFTKSAAYAVAFAVIGSLARPSSGRTRTPRTVDQGTDGTARC